MADREKDPLWRGVLLEGTGSMDVWGLKSEAHGHVTIVV